MFCRRSPAPLYRMLTIVPSITPPSHRLAPSRFAAAALKAIEVPASRSSRVGSRRNDSEIDRPVPGTDRPRHSTLRERSHSEGTRALCASIIQFGGKLPHPIASLAWPAIKAQVASIGYPKRSVATGGSGPAAASAQRVAQTANAPVPAVGAQRDGRLEPVVGYHLSL